MNKLHDILADCMAILAQSIPMLMALAGIACVIALALATIMTRVAS